MNYKYPLYSGTSDENSLNCKYCGKPHSHKSEKVNCELICSFEYRGRLFCVTLPSEWDEFKNLPTELPSYVNESTYTLITNQYMASVSDSGYVQKYCEVPTRRVVGIEELLSGGETWDEIQEYVVIKAFGKDIWDTYLKEFREVVIHFRGVRGDYSAKTWLRQRFLEIEASGNYKRVWVSKERNFIFVIEYIKETFDTHRIFIKCYYKYQ